MLDVEPNLQVHLLFPQLPVTTPIPTSVPIPVPTTVTIPPYVPQTPNFLPPNVSPYYQETHQCQFPYPEQSNYEGISCLNYIDNIGFCYRLKGSNLSSDLSEMARIWHRSCPMIVDSSHSDYISNTQFSNTNLDLPPLSSPNSVSLIRFDAATNAPFSTNQDVMQEPAPVRDYNWNDGNFWVQT